MTQRFLINHKGFLSVSYFKDLQIQGIIPRLQSFVNRFGERKPFFFSRFFDFLQFRLTRIDLNGRTERKRIDKTLFGRLSKETGNGLGVVSELISMLLGQTLF